ncbi:DUF2497 domain-containing protein [Brucella sp. 6810]|uniref:PopZ family protein n=1 Tax=Brucella sp. 6810 TaxID=2769351 RepID=UPI00165B2DA7|nr:PopZ family protein [Brucella sp. 6810]QNQ62460.1 DUF2497 domain-containing protein [Brucella sp. 6810]
MAQTSSAAREPSMEEILASIRRIIEDSDVSRHPVPGASSFPARGEVAEFRRPAAQQDEKPETVLPENPSMMQGIFNEQPSLRGPLTEAAEEVVVTEELEQDEEDDIVLDAQNDDRRDEEVAPVATRAAPVSEEAAHTAEPLGAPVEAALVEPRPEENFAKGESEMSTNGKEPAAILSEATQRHVAAAFQDLNHVVHSAPRRSFDEIAAELLRPMLQDWLDKNLPTLVERLVREEIERVVRGER